MILCLARERVIQNQRQKARRPRGQSTTTVPRLPQYGPFPNALAAAGIDPGTDAGPSTQRVSTFLRDPSAISAETYSGAGTSASLPVERTSRREAHAPEGYATSTTSQLAGPGIPGPTGHRTPSLRVEEPPLLTSMAAESRMTARYSPVRPYASTSFATRGTTELYNSSRAVRGTQSAGSVTRSSQSPLSYTLPPILPDRASTSTANSSTGHALMPNVSGNAPQLSPASEIFAQRNPHIPPPFTLEPRPQWDDSSFSPFSRRLAAPPHYPGGSLEIPHNSSSPPLVSLEGRDSGTMPLVRDSASMQSAASGAHSGPSLPPPQALLGSLWPPRGSISHYTEPRESRRTSAHSDDFENDSNVNRSR